jgi:prolipoprotein diacylglyceryltransferase
LYPDFRYLVAALGIDPPQWLGLFKTFGLLVALSFIAAAATTSMELKRKEREGIFKADIEEVVVGKKASPLQVLLSAVLAFLLGYKIGGIITNYSQVMPDPMAYIFSAKGNWYIGLIGLAANLFAVWRERKKIGNNPPQVKHRIVHPHDRMGEILTVAAIAGFAGAKIFNAFESWDDFLANPASLLASAGFTFYGGLITAAIAMYFYVRKRGWSFRQFCDATAPGLILAYGIGRLGCQFAGDGDWGIINSAYITAADGSLRQTESPEEYRTVLQQHPAFARDQAANDGVQARYVVAPAGLPRWAVAMNYPKNVNNVGMPLAGCTGDYCSVLPTAVFPTPIYEAIAGILIFCLLWAVRKRMRRPLQLFGLYLLLNGLERFLVEHIRVNYKYDWGFLHPSQAEIISACLMVAGVIILLFYRPKPQLPVHPETT